MSDLTITTKVNIDLYSANTQVIRTKQYDSQVRKVEVVVTKNGVAFPLSSTKHKVAIRMLTPDNRHIFNNCEITSDGTAIIVFTQQMTNQAGRCYLDLDIYDIKNKYTITTCSFLVIIEEASYEDEVIELTDEFTELTELILKATDVTTSEAERVANENTRIANENERISNESERVSEYSSMKSEFQIAIQEAEKVNVVSTSNDNFYSVKTTNRSGEVTESPNLALLVGTVTSVSSNNNAKITVENRDGIRYMNFEIPTGKDIRITHVYKTMDAMTADLANIPQYDYFMINDEDDESATDNGKWFFKTDDSTGYLYMGKMSTSGMSPEDEMTSDELEAIFA